MLVAHLRAGDLALAWRSTPTGWVAGRSVIQPFAHPVLHAEMRCSPRRLAVVVRERVGGMPDRPASYQTVTTTERGLAAWLAEASAWPLEFLMLVITRTDDGSSVRLTAGSWGTAPVYLHTHRGVLRVSWDVAELYAELPSTALDIGITAQYLLGLDHPYSRRTIFSEIGMLTERSQATWRAPFKRVHITYPVAVEHSTARRLRPRADVVGTFRDILESSMRRWRADDQEPVAIELSGGLDSSLVATAAATLSAPAQFSYGMIMPGLPGEYQRARRVEVIRRTGFTDREFPCIEHPPFHPRSHRVLGDGVVPWAEFYEEAVGHLLDLARADGIRSIFTGMGGDELCSYQPGESEADDEADNALSDTANSGDAYADDTDAYPAFLSAAVIDAYHERDSLIDDAPQALSFTSALESAAAVSSLYLRKGVWPISPLTTPELVEFCRRLPLKWRHERRIHRQALARRGFSKRLTHPRPSHLETFLGVMSYALGTAAAPVIEEVFRDSLLAERGLIDCQALLQSYRKYRVDRSERHGDQILAALMLELTLRSLQRRRDSRQG